MTNRRSWVRRGLLAALTVLAGEQLWRHGRDYIFADQFAVVEPGKIYRGAWQQPWPMRRIVHRYKIKTVLALAHPPDHPLAVREKAMARDLGYHWVHIPIVDQRGTNDWNAINDQLDRAAAVLADPKNHPIYFHCHHGINRASMVQIAFRTKYCGWTLEQATAEISRTFGLVEVSHGPDYRHMQSFYIERVLPHRPPQSPTTTAQADQVPLTLRQRGAGRSSCEGTSDRYPLGRSSSDRRRDHFPVWQGWPGLRDAPRPPGRPNHDQELIGSAIL